LFEKGGGAGGFRLFGTPPRHFLEILIINLESSQR